MDRVTDRDRGDGRDPGGRVKRTAFPSHDFPDEGEVRVCPDCQSEWDTRIYDKPPKWPCRRRKRLKRTGDGLQRSGGGLKRTPLEPVSETNSGREHQVDEPYREWVRSQHCLTCDAPPRSDAAHVFSWGSGAGDWEDGHGNLVPLCRVCHGRLHTVGVETFEMAEKVDLTSEAARIGEEYRREQEAV